MKSQSTHKERCMLRIYETLIQILAQLVFIICARLMRADRGQSNNYSMNRNISALPNLKMLMFVLRFRMKREMGESL